MFIEWYIMIKLMVKIKRMPPGFPLYEVFKRWEVKVIYLCHMMMFLEIIFLIIREAIN
jgi:uncharacterized membrane protein